ncbi:hypothetical protein, partial [Enterococcus faecium]
KKIFFSTGIFFSLEEWRRVVFFCMKENSKERGGLGFGERVWGIVVVEERVGRVVGGVVGKFV